MSCRSKFQKLSTLFACLGIGAIISACAGIDGDDLLKGPGSGGTGSSGPVFSRGVIDDTDGLHMGSISYGTEAVIVTNDVGAIIQKSQLQSGMVVELHGVFVESSDQPQDSQRSFNGGQPGNAFSQPSIDSSVFSPENQLTSAAVGQFQGSGELLARANVVRLKSEARGPISRLLSDGFMVNGMLVTADNSTKVTPGTRLGVGDWIEVFGLYDPTARAVVATLVRQVDPGQYKLTGSLESIDSQNSQIVLNGLTIDTAQVNLPHQTLAPGARVQVYYQISGAGDNYQASDVRIAGSPLPGSGTIYLDGFVSDFQSITEFFINQVSINGLAAIAADSAGGMSNLIQTGARIQVVGQVSQGQVVASRINIIPRSGGVNILIGGR
ncbi:MAG: DUF5666 domain-containing protein [Burkholderiaceae bacterium]